MPKPSYCISPWSEGVLRMNDKLVPCCRSPINFGEWKEGALPESWHSQAAVEMRQKIRAGEFPDEACRLCYQNGSHNPPKKHLHKPVREFCNVIAEEQQSKWILVRRFVENLLGRSNDRFDVKRLLSITRLFDKRELDEESETILNEFRETIADHQRLAKSGSRYALALQKLSVIADVLQDFLAGCENPKHVAPFRQVNLIAICNARCIQCQGLHTGELEAGVPDGKGGFFRFMDRTDIEDSFINEESVIDFFTNGSEFLLLKDWKLVAHRLDKLGVKPRISTNGMLLTKPNVDYLVSNNLAGRFNLSVDGASKSTVEYIRARVDFDRLTENSRYLFDQLQHYQRETPITLAFCLMKENYSELAEFVDYVSSLIGDNKVSSPNILVQPLTQSGHPNYLEFLKTQHPSMVDHGKIVQCFEAMLERSQIHKIPVTVFYHYPLDQFVRKGCPIPTLQQGSPMEASAEVVQIHQH